MKIVLALLFLGVILSAEEIATSACDSSSHQTTGGLKGNFLKKDSLQGEFCDHQEEADSTENSSENKSLDNLKTFLNSSKSENKALTN